MNVRECGGDDAGGEGGGVEFVVSVEDEGDIEGPCGRFRRLDAVEHPQEIAGVRKGAIGRNDFEALANAIVNGNDHRDLGGQVVRLADICVVRVVLFVGIVEAERRHRSSKDLHWRGGCRKGAKHIYGALIERAGKGEL